MNRKLIEQKFLEMLEEDGWDITSSFVPNKPVHARIITKEPCIISGIKELRVLFDMLNIDVMNSAKDGQELKEREILFELAGKAQDILTAERIALNVISRMSGITTITRKYVDKVKAVNPGVRVAATRKTVPLMRYFDKKAAFIGGGDTHRLGLNDCVMLKDNHLTIFKSLEDAIKAAKDYTSFAHKIEVEVQTTDDAITAAEHADIVMLDNMTPGMVGETVEKLKQANLRNQVLVEVSGNITFDNIGDYAVHDIDVISSGSITNNVKCIDFSLKFTSI